MPLTRAEADSAFPLARAYAPELALDDWLAFSAHRCATPAAGFVGIRRWFERSAYTLRAVTFAGPAVA